MEFYMKKFVLYSRTSHRASNPQNQINELKKVANRFGWKLLRNILIKVLVKQKVEMVDQSLMPCSSLQ